MPRKEFKDERVDKKERKLLKKSKKDMKRLLKEVDPHKKYREIPDNGIRNA